MTSRKVHPLALKESKDRWYLIAIDTKDKILKSFGLTGSIIWMWQKSVQRKI
jgi:hypothetical protein